MLQFTTLFEWGAFTGIADLALIVWTVLALGGLYVSFVIVFGPPVLLFEDAVETWQALSAGWGRSSSASRADVATARRMAERGDAEAQFDLGRRYEAGKGVPRNYAEAVRWYRRAAEQGYIGAQNSLGIMYAKGCGVPQDYSLAHKWFDLAAVNGRQGRSPQA